LNLIFFWASCRNFSPFNVKSLMDVHICYNIRNLKINKLCPTKHYQG
jgi:hypothetical protein